jgi:hypothetical protein
MKVQRVGLQLQCEATGDKIDMKTIALFVILPRCKKDVVQ